MIQRYDSLLQDLRPMEFGAYVLHEDHRAAVRELVEALQTCAEIVEWVSGAYPNRPDWETECNDALAIARAAIEKATGGEE